MFTSLIKKKLPRNVMCLKSCCFWFFFLGSTTSSSTLHNEAEIGDDDVFTVSTCHLRLFSFMLQFAWSSWKGFSFYASGLAYSHLHVWPVGVFYLVEVYPLQKVEPWVSIGLLSPREKHGRADVVRARSEWITTLKFPMSWPEWCTHLLIALFPTDSSGWLLLRCILKEIRFWIAVVNKSQLLSVLPMHEMWKVKTSVFQLEESTVACHLPNQRWLK